MPAEAPGAMESGKAKPTSTRDFTLFRLQKPYSILKAD